MLKEASLKRRFIRRLKEIYPHIIVFRGDPNTIQGIPDQIFLLGDRWLALEFKASTTAEVRPNQKYWVTKMNEHSFARFIYPENEEDVLNDILQAFPPAK